MATALLIIDMQHALCSGEDAAFDIDNVIEKINVLSRRARALGVPVVIVQHEEDEGPLQFGSKGWPLAAGLLTADKDAKVTKKTPNSFHQTELHALLQTAA